MRKWYLSLLLILSLLGGCSQTAQPADPSPEDALTTQAVLDAYTEAAEIYSWFDLASLPYNGEDTRQADGQTYYRVTEARTPTLEALRELAETSFTPELTDALFAMTPDQYRDIDGALYTTGGGRGSNPCLLDRTVTAVRAAESRWTVTVTFWADFEGQEIHADGHAYPVATVGFSKKELDYEFTGGGWRFTSFCPADGLNLKAGTVYDFDYEEDLLSGAYQDFSDWELVCYLLHADGAYAEAPFDLLAHRFLERPNDILRVLAFLESSPYQEKYPHVETIVADPGYSAAGYFYREDRADFAALLGTLHPETEAEQAVLDKIQAAYESSVTEDSPIETEFALIVPGEQRVLTLGAQEGAFPWGYELEGTVTHTSPGDTYGTVYEVDCGDLQLAYSVSPDDGTEYLFRLSTTTPYDQSGGTLCTPRGLYCGYGVDTLKEIYSHAVELTDFQSDAYDACYVYEPGGDAGGKHIAFYITGGAVAAIEIEDLRDGRLLE